MLLHSINVALHYHIYAFYCHTMLLHEFIFATLHEQTGNPLTAVPIVSSDSSFQFSLLI